MIVSPSILSADFSQLGKDVKMLNGSADLIHLDIMDGNFVPNISFGFPVIESICPISKIDLDAHLMTVHPERWFEKLASLGVRMVSFHLEAAGCHTGEYIRKIQSLGMKAGVAIDPDVNVKKLFKYIGKADFFLIMSVFAGFGGQKFIYDSIDRAARLKAEISKRGAKALIEMDGGIGPDNVKALKEAGCDIVVAGNSVFKAKDPEAVIKALREA